MILWWIAGLVTVAAIVAVSCWWMWGHGAEPVGPQRDPDWGDWPEDQMTL